MKILLREYKGEDYVWVTAKYNGRQFVVNGRGFDEYQIVSVINDNRKNYIKCSCCGKIFPKKGKQFEKHKEEASSDTPCLKCDKLRYEKLKEGGKKYVMNDDGTYILKTETEVRLYCDHSIWNNFYIDSGEARRVCKFRQCGGAHASEIFDTFTTFPGIFDNIITVDKILDNGYEEIQYSDYYTTSYLMDSNLGIIAYVNSLGIVDHFYIENRGKGKTIWYSKRYNILFSVDDTRHYDIWCSNPNNEILKYIANLYK